ncbi:MAG TPA: sulfatase [Fimbriiglobus sp.]|nr:sulfatase [Fimbriiglobus sp.]
MVFRTVSSLCVLCALCGELFSAERPNVLVLLADDLRWDSVGCAGNPVVVTPNIDRLAKDGVRFTQARVTTSICMVSRATILTGQHMARHGITAFGKPLTAAQFAHSYPGVLRAAGYHTGYVGKYGVGQPPKDRFDFARVYHGRHWIDVKGEKVHVTEKNTRDALAFLAGRPKGKPFCLCVGFFAPHAEDRAPEQYLPQPWSAKFYEGKTIPVPMTATEEHIKKLPPFLAADKNEGRVRWRKRFDTPAKYQTYMTNYYRLVTEVDAGIGRILDELREQGAMENTLVVFTGDNGYFHGERGLADKWYPYEEALRVPLIVRDPRLAVAKRGATSAALVLNLDIAPTVIAAAGAAVPEGVQGRDVVPLYLAATPPTWRTDFYYQHPVVLGKDRIPRSEAVASRTAKYVRWPDFDFEELYDLTADPHEERNLATGPASKLLADLRDRLERLRDEAR